MMASVRMPASCWHSRLAQEVPHCPLSSIGYYRNEVVWPLRLGCKGFCSFCLVLSWIASSGGSQLPRWEKTQAVLQRGPCGEELQLPATSQHPLTQSTDEETEAQRMRSLPTLTQLEGPDLGLGTKSSWPYHHLIVSLLLEQQDERVPGVVWNRTRRLKFRN